MAELTTPGVYVEEIQTGVQPIGGAQLPTQGVFGPIALSLSGGGYRAAAFHLGTLSYLNRIGLLKDVSILSTVSGGTLVGMKYALSAQEGILFQQFYNEFYVFLRDVNLNKLSLQRVGDPDDDTFLKYSDLITSFADVYDERLLNGKRFEVFWDNRPNHLKDIIFNSTEFRTGIAFRFQKSSNPSAKIGNGNISISLDTAKMIRLADIAAASSCFPGGFEPIAFPNDFDWPGNQIPSELQGYVQHPIPMMDGGIYDNQGIDSIIVAIDRNDEEIGAFLISDTDTLQEELFPYPKEPTSGGLTLSALNIVSLCAIFILGLSGIAAIVQHVFFPVANPFVQIILYTIPGILTLFMLCFMVYLRVKIKNSVMEKVPRVQTSVVWEDFKKLRFTQVVGLLDLRLKSLYALTSRIFMKRIRGVVYKEVFQDERFEKKRISNLIYDLLRTQKEQVSPILNPSDTIIAVAKKAAEMPTTLWFNDESEGKALVACGHFTTCYNMLEFIYRYHMIDGQADSPAIKTVYDQALSDWKKFQDKPLFLI